MRNNACVEAPVFRKLSLLSPRVRFLTGSQLLPTYHAMAHTGPTLSSSGTVQIRFVSLDLGTTKWREGTFEIVEKDNKASLCLRFNCGTSKFFQLSQNIKTFSQNPSRIQLTLKDNSVIVLDKVPQTLLQRTNDYLKKLKQEKEVRKSFNGSGNFSVLGTISVKNESKPPEKKQVNIVQKSPRLGRSDCLEDAAPKRPLVSPSRPASTPSFYGLSANRNEKRKRSLPFISDLAEEPPKEQDSSRTSSSAQTTTGSSCSPLPRQSTPFKRIHRSMDYGGWKKPKLSTPAQPQPPLQGFSNLGNTCYMNAILQSLFSVPSFSKDMLSQSIPWSAVPINGLIRCFVHLLAKKDVGSFETKKDLLRKVKSAISSTVERFSGNMQHDAHEFLCQCLDQLKEEMAKVNKSLAHEPMACSPGGNSGQDSVPSTAKLGGPKEAGTSHIYTCPVADNMEFEVQHTITCRSCGEVVTKHERFNDLSIDLPCRKKNVTLSSIQDSLDLFFRMEEIEYSCEKCSGKAATVSHKFSKLPRVLILHLKRYNYDPQLSLNNKLGQAVVIPRYLTLLSHCTEVTQPPVSISWTAPTSVPVEEEPWNSPDTGFEDTEAQDLAYITDLQPADMDEFLDMTMDEDKENQTPRGLQWESNVDLAPHCNRNQEREEQELQQALTQSLMERAAQEMREDDDLRRAKELSLQEFNRSLPELLCPDEDFGNQDVMDTNHTEAEAESLKRNAESGDLANSFRLLSVVSHIGGSSSFGHYISDVYDMKKQSWLTYNDLEVSETQEAVVQRDRDRSGYIFFYMHKDVLEQLFEMEKSGGIATTGGRQCCSTPVKLYSFKLD